MVKYGGNVVKRCCKYGGHVVEIWWICDGNMVEYGGHMRKYGGKAQEIEDVQVGREQGAARTGF